jgi:Fungalysin metallopeptidase (M36)/Secretion system C-terminal sorting domain/Bacterial pre-peptidase C-terminal domain/Fibronectin type III domain
MKKFLIFLAFLIVAFNSNAQVTDVEKNIATNLLQKNSKATGLASADLDNSTVSETYIIPASQIRVVKLQQRYLGVPVYNQMQVMAFKNDQLVSNTGKRMQGVEQLSKNANAIPVVSAISAVKTSLAALKIQSSDNITTVETLDSGRKVEFDKKNFSLENISAELIWFPVNDGKELKLIWQVFVAPLKGEDYWLVRIDAATNSFINKQSLTVKCNWDNKDHSMQEHINNNHPKPNFPENNKPADVNNSGQTLSPLLVNSATYRVIKYPAESPLHPGGAPALVTNPWTMAPGNATTLGWHNDGKNSYSTTRGNNVYAYEDRDSNNLPGLSAISTAAQPNLSFDFMPDFTIDPTEKVTVPNQQFNTTNLFYWNNLMHDLSYIYGFDEPSGNFQNDNQNRGGRKSDYVLAEAQDGLGFNNANMATPADGRSPRMQMYLWFGNPLRDGDADNGIIAHEYTHGISTRLTGNGSTCLFNAEQMGEGWSDYFALMSTQDWATTLPGDGFSKPRGIVSYSLGQPAAGSGIRQYKYTTDMGINPLTYADLPTAVIPHGVGTIWCSALWDMTWEIIQLQGINPNIFNIAGGGGNSIAMKLVMEGMRLNPCSPGFIDARNSILKADTLLFGARYSCAIMKAFARRGMGIGALQGSSNSITDQTISFLNCSLQTCAVPTGLTTTANATDSAVLHWNRVSGAVSYRVDYQAPGFGPAWTVAALATTDTSIIINGLTNNTNYTWRVQTNCSSVSSPQYAQAFFTTELPCVAPSLGFPSNLSIHTATLNWAPVTKAISYTVEYKKSTATTWVVATIPGTTLPLTGLDSATVYNWRVFTNCPAGPTAYATAQFTTASLCVAPTGLTATDITSSSATISWNRVLAATSSLTYRLERKLSSDTTWTVLTTSFGDTSLNFTFLPAATSYDWRVSTNCQIGNSVYSQSKFTTGAACNAPVVAFNPISITTNSAVVDWAPVPGAVSYRVEYAQVPVNTWTVIDSATTSISANITGLLPGFLYEWRVKTNCATSVSVYSGNLFQTSLPPCQLPYDTASNNTALLAGTIPLNVTINGLISTIGDIDFYKFVITAGGPVNVFLVALADYNLTLYNSNGKTKIASSATPGSGNEFISTTLAAGTYYVKVDAAKGIADSNNCYALTVSGIGSLTSAAITSNGVSSAMPNIDAVTKTSVYPNPANKSVTVSIMDLKTTAAILLYDMYGKLLAKQTTHQSKTAMDISRLASGTYIIKVLNNGKEDNLKIVKQ